MGVNGALTDPSIRVVAQDRSEVAENHHWSTAVTAGRGRAVLAADLTRFGAFALTAGSRDAAVLVHNTPLGPYTAPVTAVGNGTGIVLNETCGPVSGTQRLLNLSARPRVGSSDSVLIAGFAIAGNTPADQSGGDLRCAFER